MGCAVEQTHPTGRSTPRTPPIDRRRNQRALKPLVKPGPYVGRARDTSIRGWNDRLSRRCSVRSLEDWNTSRLTKYVHAAVEHGVADLDVGLGSRNARPPATDGRLLAMPWPGSSSSRLKGCRAVIGLPPEQEQTRKVDSPTGKRVNAQLKVSGILSPHSVATRCRAGFILGRRPPAAGLLTHLLRVSRASTPVNPWRPACSARRRSGLGQPVGEPESQTGVGRTHGSPSRWNADERAFARTLGHPSPVW